MKTLKIIRLLLILSFALIFGACSESNLEEQGIEEKLKHQLESVGKEVDQTSKKIKKEAERLEKNFDKETESLREDIEETVEQLEKKIQGNN